MPVVIKFEVDNIDKLAREIADYISQGKIVAIPTDTCYGLAADATNVKSVRKVFNIKKRPKSKPISVFLCEKNDLEKYVELSSLARKIAELFPARITIVFRAKTSNIVSRYVIWKKTLGVRIPPFIFPRLIVKYLGTPITATSANIHGLPPIYNSRDLLKLKGVDYIVDYGQLPKTKVSTVIDVSEERIKVLREGAISLTELKRRLERLSLDDYELIIPK